jgi:membrane-bound ClpP family serine protease
MKVIQQLKVIPGRIYLRYILINLPGVAVLLGILFLIKLRLALPGWAVAGVVAAWVLKDIVLFPFIWRSYDWDRPGISRTMTGSVGFVKEPLAPKGFVQIDGELWKAKTVDLEEVIERGATVKVVKRVGLTLQVEPCAATEASDRKSL